MPSCPGRAAGRPGRRAPAVRSRSRSPGAGLLLSAPASGRRAGRLSRPPVLALPSGARLGIRGARRRRPVAARPAPVVACCSVFLFSYHQSPPARWWHGRTQRGASGCIAGSREVATYAPVPPVVRTRVTAWVRSVVSRSGRVVGGVRQDGSDERRPESDGRGTNVAASCPSTRSGCSTSPS